MPVLSSDPYIQHPKPINCDLTCISLAYGALTDLGTMRWSILTMLFPTLLFGQVKEDTLPEAGIMQARGMGGIMGGQGAAEGWYFAWKQDRSVNLAVWDTALVRMPLQMDPLHKSDLVLEVLRTGDDLLVVSGHGPHRTRVVIGADGREHARSTTTEAAPLVSPDPEMPLKWMTSHVAKPLRMHWGSGMGNFIHTERSMEDERGMLLKCMDRDLTPRWEHQVMPPSARERVFLRILDVAHNKALVHVVLSRQ